MSKGRFFTFVASALLILALYFIFEWQDQVKRLAQESAVAQQQLQQQKRRNIQVDDLAHSLHEQDQIEKQWLEKLVGFNTAGVFRAMAMEQIAGLCTRHAAPCQVSALGETSLGEEKKPTPRPTKAAPENTKSHKKNTGASHPTLDSLGIVSAGVKLTLPLTSSALYALLYDIENGTTLRRISRFSVNAGRAEITIDIFGMNKQTLDQLLATQASTVSPAGTSPTSSSRALKP